MVDSGGRTVDSTRLVSPGWPEEAAAADDRPARSETTSDFDPPEILQALGVSAEVIGKKPSVLREHSLTVECLGRSGGTLKMHSVSAEVLVLPFPFFSQGSVIEVIGIQSEQTPAYADTVTNAVTSQQSVPPVDQIISKTETLAVMHYAVAGLSAAPVQSVTGSAFSANLVVTALPVSVISTMRVGQSLAVQLAAAPDYMRPDEYFSRVEAREVAVLVLQSIDIPYVPQSGVFAAETWSLAVQKRPAERIPRSPVSVCQYISQAVLKRPDAIPQSLTTVPQLISQAAVLAVFDDRTVGVEHSAAVTAYVVQQSPLPIHLSDVSVKSATNLVLATDSDSQGVPQSVTGVKSVTALQLTLTPDYHVQSRSRTQTINTYAVSSLPMVPPINMMVWGRADAVLALVAGAADDYPDPSVASTPVSVMTAVQLAAVGTEYLSPGDIYADSQVQQVVTVRYAAARSNPMPLPKSYVPVPQFVEYVTRSEPLPAPDVVLHSGLHARLVTQPVAYRADYPDANVPASDILASQVIEHVARSADYPDAHIPTAHAVASQVLEHTACVDSFPDPATLFRPLVVRQVLEHGASTVSYPDPETLHKPVSVSLIMQQVSAAATYPDKDMPQSFVYTGQVLEHVAVNTQYPDKNAPQSNARTRLILEHVIAADKAMYELPTPPRSHRVQVTCRFVYT